MNALIIEDEKPAANRLCKILNEIDPTIHVLDIIDTIDESIAWFRQNVQPDIIFMDIQLADGNSFEIFKNVSIKAPVIFVTAYDEFALNAFKVNSVDYLLKPIKPRELETALQKLHSIFLLPESANIKSLIENRTQEFKDRFVIKLGNKLITVLISDIAYLFSKDKMTFICDREGKHYPMDLSLDKIESMIDPKLFFRINRQIIAHYQAIKEIQTTQKSRLIIVLDPPTALEAYISSERSAIFKKWLKRE